MKRSSNRLVLLVGIFLAVVAFVLIAVMMGGGGPSSTAPSAPPTTAKVVVATSDIPLGSRITSAMVGTKDFPINDKPSDSYSDVALVIGQTARQPVASGQLITSAILNASGSVQDISVPAGYVGIAVQVDQITGVGTLIKPGDRVDVVTGFGTFPLVTYRSIPTPTPRASASPQGPANVIITNVDVGYDQNSVKTVVEGLQVLGTLLPPTPDQGQDQGAAASGQPGTTLTGQQEIVILAATSQQAEAIRFAQVSGTIALVLRSAADCQAADGTPSTCPIVPTTGVTLRQMVDQFGVLPPQVVEVLMPTPYPSPMPSMLFPSPSPSPSPSGLASPSANP